jgi:hypothetical protein
VTWLIEILDIQKDLTYFWFLEHSLVLIYLFAFSIAAPFGVFHYEVNLMKGTDGKDAIPSTGITHSLIIYIGMT